MDKRETSLKKKFYLQLAICAFFVLINAVLSGVIAYKNSGETADYPVLVPLLDIYYWLLMMPTLALVIGYAKFRWLLAAWVVILYVVNLAIYNLF